LEVKDLKEILQLLDEKDIAEFELEDQGVKLRIRKAVAAPPVAAPAPVMAPPVLPAPTASGPVPALAPTQAAAGPAVSAPAAAEEEGLILVKSPIVGTFYRAPAPTAPAFVDVGDRVKVGQVLCIVEAMKLMNEIESEAAGEIVKIHPENGQPVQYGDPLFSLRPAR
jgi:acetyl-CoA carboxylase biotin carboxyl carrier protein